MLLIKINTLKTLKIKNLYFRNFITSVERYQNPNVFQRREFEPKLPPKNGPLPKVPDRAKVVVCGGGITGASVAYHLAASGWADGTVLIEQATIGGGNPWLQSGLAGRFYPTFTEIKLAQYSIDLIKDLTKSGHPTGWKECGSINVARTFDRMIWYQRMKSMGVAWGIDCEILTPEQIKERCNILEVSDLAGGLWIPSDGSCHPQKLCHTFVNEAKRMGATIVEHCALQKVHQTDGKISKVTTTSGEIECEFFVNCTGLWARHVGTLSKPTVKIPLQSVEHHFLHSKPIPWLDENLPIIRDMDGQIYFRENEGKLLAGGFELKAKPVFVDGSVPLSQNEREMPPDWDHFHVLLDELLKRAPKLREVVADRLSNGPEAFSPDCQWILGESPEIRNYFISAGMKTVGVGAAGGVGRAISDIIVKGYSKLDLHMLDITRFLGLHSNKKFLKNRGKEIPGWKYKINYPFSEYEAGRNLRMSPIYLTLKEAGAVFGQTMGYERPCYFDQKDKLDEHGITKFRIAQTNTFAKPPWFDFVASEYHACRERVGVADYSSFTKFDISSNGREVVDFLQYLCSNDVDVAPGSIIHTGMQNDFGGYENDCSLARISENKYLMIAPTSQQTRSMAWLKKHLPPKSGINISDVTSMYTAICIIGPYSKILLSELTDTDLSRKNFPFFTYMELDVGLANGVHTMNITHTGELGYVLYIPNEFALHVYDRVWEAGQRYGVQHAGYYATRALRIEKFFAFWGQDLDTFTTPLECGRSWRVKFDKDIDFIGREALLQQKKEGVKRMYVQLLLNDHDPDIDLWPWGNEPIYRNGKYCGMTTTTGYGFTLKRQVCLGFIRNLDENGVAHQVTNEYVLSGSYEVDVAGMKFDAKVSLHSPNIPTNFPDKEREAYHATRDKQGPGNLLSYPESKF